MKTLLFSHGDCLYHDTGSGHPERPDRLRAVLHALGDDAFAALDRRDAPKATETELTRAHSEDYVATVFRKVPEAGLQRLAGQGILPSPQGWGIPLRRRLFRPTPWFWIEPQLERLRYAPFRLLGSEPMQ